MYMVLEYFICVDTVCITNTNTNNQFKETVTYNIQPMELLSNLSSTGFN